MSEQDKTTTKVRAVFDASSKSEGLPSLNDCLYTGPNLLARIFDVLLRFRLNEIGITSDIKQAFLNVEISEGHRNYLRHIWFDEKAELLIYRFCRVVFGVNSSPFLLGGTIHVHLEKFLEDLNLKEVVEKLEDDLYVDDCISGVSFVEEGVDFYEKTKSLMCEAGFDLRKWITNNKELQSYIDAREWCLQDLIRLLGNKSINNLFIFKIKENILFNI